jgi:hypothetical protein
MYYLCRRMTRRMHHHNHDNKNKTLYNQHHNLRYTSYIQFLKQYVREDQCKSPRQSSREIFG